MPLVLTEEQEMLRESAEGFVKEHAPVSLLRRLREEDVPERFDRGVWKDMAEMGFAGVLVPEEQGGSAFGFVGAGVIAEAMGRTLAASPFLSSSVMGATALGQAGTEDQKDEYLAGAATGDRILTLAVDERRKHGPHHVETRAERSGNGFKLTGDKTFVADGLAADTIIVAARTGGGADEQDGITLFLVDAKADGVTRERMATVDERGHARIRLDGVEVDGDAVLGTVDQGYGPLEKALNGGRSVLCAEMTGAAGAAFDMTMDYLKERKQFGREIGSFQALQHRAAHLLAEMEMARAVTLQALQAMDEDMDQAGGAVSLAKAKVGQVAKLATQEAIQMHGGIGMTDEYDVGFYLKRVRVAQEMLGDPDFHANRLASTLRY